MNSPPEKNFLRFRIPSARKGEGGGNVPRETHQKTNVSQEKDKIRKHERELENVVLSFESVAILAQVLSYPFGWMGGH